MPFNTFIIDFEIGPVQQVFGELSFYKCIVKLTIRDAQFHFNY